MLDINEALKQREETGTPLRLGLIGTGKMGTDIIAVTSVMKGIKVVIAANLNLERAKEAFIIGYGDSNVTTANSSVEADLSILSGKNVAVDDYRIVTDCKNIDLIIESTGVPEIGAIVAIRSVRNNHDIVMMNVETDVTIGPLLRWYAEKKSKLYTLAAGDEPPACKEIYDFAKALGFTIVAVGKGKNNPLDIHSSPKDREIQEEAAIRGFTPNRLVEFIDGTKTMIEMAAVSNATGLLPDRRGMHGPDVDRDHIHDIFKLKKDGGILSRLGVVDYCVGNVAPGVFVVVKTEHPRLREAMSQRSMGNGPYYTLIRPYHLCSIEVPLSCAQLEIQQKTTMVPLDRLFSEVIAVAKKDILPGELLDKIGGESCYGFIDTYENANKEKLLPIGLAEGARLKKKISIDEPIKISDIELKQTKLSFLRDLQNSWMDGKLNDEDLLKKMDSIIV
jgi:predicted homoserine dehydrogenase-like protein